MKVIALLVGAATAMRIRRGEYDTTEYEQDYINAKNNMTKKAKEQEKALNEMAETTFYPVKTFEHAENKFVSKYKISAANQHTYNDRMTDEERETKGHLAGGQYVQLDFIDPGTNQLTYDEYLKDDKYKDFAEWHDVDFTFTANHPDWGADSIVKQYFKEASLKKATASR